MLVGLGRKGLVKSRSLSVGGCVMAEIQVVKVVNRGAKPENATPIPSFSAFPLAACAS